MARPIPSATARPADAADPAPVSVLAARIKATFGAIDVLHCNAGVIVDANMQDHAVENVTAKLSVNSGRPGHAGARQGHRLADRRWRRAGAPSRLSVDPHRQTEIRALADRLFHTYGEGGVPVAAVTFAIASWEAHPRIAKAFWALRDQPQDGWRIKTVHDPRGASHRGLRAMGSVPALAFSEAIPRFRDFRWIFPFKTAARPPNTPASQGDTMTIAIRFDEVGPPSVLRVADVKRQRPGPGEVWLEQAAIGVNYLDITQRNGAVKIPMPNGIGLEAAGRVAEIGPEVAHLAVGDRVVYALGPLGAYASGRLYPAQRLVKLPDDVSFEAAAAIFFKGLTAQYLLKSTYPVQPGTVVLAYGAAGGVGQILTAWARHLGARVIGVVSRPSSVARAAAAGCSDVLIWGQDDLPTQVARLTDGQKADVVYDGIGRLTFDASLDCLRPRGTMVSIGASSGVPDPVSLATLNGKGSLFLTRPGLAHHITDPDEYRMRARDVLDAVGRGIFAPHIAQRFPLVEAARAHEAVESGIAKGAVVLTV